MPTQQRTHGYWISNLKKLTFLKNCSLFWFILGGTAQRRNKVGLHRTQALRSKRRTFPMTLLPLLLGSPVK